MLAGGANDEQPSRPSVDLAEVLLGLCRAVGDRQYLLDVIRKRPEQWGLTVIRESA